MNNLTPEDRNRLQDALLVVYAEKLRARNRANLTCVIYLAIILISIVLFFAIQWGII